MCSSVDIWDPIIVIENASIIELSIYGLIAGLRCASYALYLYGVVLTLL